MKMGEKRQDNLHWLHVIHPNIPMEGIQVHLNWLVAG